tara:strand:- start:608 stop:820 length:213 start_codon:yes stop_codon:yes gene_type:complete
MFTAMVLACAIGSTDASKCIEATDEWGPYKTEAECKMRVHQMVTALQMTLPVPMQFHYKCEEPKPEGMKL